MEAFMPESVVETRGLTVFYGKHRGITEVNLTVERGEVFGFLGPNGAGKTTTLRVLLDIIRPNQGSAALFGLDCQRDGVAARQRVGYLPGELAYPDTLRGRDYLNLLDALRGKSADAEWRRQLCARFDLDISRHIRQYSRGNKQKLALVAAFMHKPDLLILDEPTGGLDPLVQQAVLDTVRETRDEGRTVFFSSHILPEVQAVCDRVGIIRDGRLIAVENVADLLRRRLHRLRFTLARPATAAIQDIAGVKVVQESGPHLHLEISHNLESAMQMLAPCGILDIESLAVSLEEVFLAYYGKGGNNHHVATDRN
jgi:ABC-2 type transport system ATP-binding protein